MTIYDGAFYNVIGTGSQTLPKLIVAAPSVIGQVYDGVFVENALILSSSIIQQNNTGSTGSSPPFSGGCANIMRTSSVFKNDYTITSLSSSISQFGFVGPCTASQAPFSMGAVSLMRLRTLGKAPYVCIPGKLFTTGTLFPLGTR